MDDEELRRRLVSSRYNVGGRGRQLEEQIAADEALDDNWLQEAAQTFNISRCGGIHRRRQAEMVDLVLEKVRMERSHMRGNAHERDARRRRLDREALTDPNTVRQDAKRIGVRGEKDIDELRNRILCRTCPEELRIDVVREFLHTQQRAPGETAEEDAPFRYLQSALGRLHLSTESGEQLSDGQVAQWNELLAKLPDCNRPAWQADPIFIMACTYFQEHDDLEVPRGRKSAHADLAAALAVVRKAYASDVRDRQGVLKRRKLKPQAVALWEREFGDSWHWDEIRRLQRYLPGECISGSRVEWPREPLPCRAYGCYLCGEDFERKSDLYAHWKDQHIAMPEGTQDELSAARIEEEIRKRLFEDEIISGPFEVRGQEHRRIIGVHAEHQTSSTPGSGGLNDDGPLRPRAARNLSGCAVCARSMWLEDLFEMDLFTKPSSRIEEGEPEEDTEESDGSQLAADESEDRRRFKVQPRCVRKVDTLLNVRRYASRWPTIPKHELFASSVEHPYLSGERWLLHTRRIEADEPVVVCEDCGKHLSAEDPKDIHMPKFALANDNWIGRLPFAFNPGGEPLTDMEKRSLARGRRRSLRSSRSKAHASSSTLPC